MPGTEILLIRHAEKPDDSDSGPGLTSDGRDDPKSLTVRGWQRAGALVPEQTAESVKEDIEWATTRAKSGMR